MTKTRNADVEVQVVVSALRMSLGPCRARCLISISYVEA